MGTMLIHGFLFVATLVLFQFDGAVVARSATKLFFVPSSARPGHVVTTLPYRLGQRSRVLASHNDISVNSFAVLSTGELILNADVSVLGGRSVRLTIQHRVPSDEWLETIQVQIHDVSPRIHFRDPPYAGHVEENQPVGAAVNGLQTMAQSVRDIPYGCQLSLVASTDATSFAITQKNGIATVVMTCSLDREHKDMYHVTVRVQCQNGDEASAIITIRVLDVNDNTPQFDSQVYVGTVALDAAVLTPAVRVSASDADTDDTLRYSLRDVTTPFDIDSTTGQIYVKSPDQLLWKTYELKAIATDGAGHESAPIVVRVEVHSPVEDTTSKPLVLVRERRDAARQERVFVVRRSDTDDLFSVAASPDERYHLTDDDEAMGLTLSPEGMVRRGSSHQWNDNVNVFSFSVNVTNVKDTAYQSNLTVKVHVVKRGDYDKIFNNTPYPLWATVPPWIRPDTVVYTVHAIDADKAKVKYKLESGGDDRFTVDSETGAVKVAGRKMFDVTTIYTLAISAQVVDSAKKKFTPAQVLSIKVDDKRPQFHHDPYIKGMSELTPRRARVIQIEAKSFQELEIIYSLVPELTDSAAALPFEIDDRTGSLTLKRELKYIHDPHQYRMIVTARETESKIESKVLVIVNLKPENLHAPYFALDVHVAKNILETIGTSEDILTVTAIDLDQGQNGLVTFTSSSDKFSVSTDGKHGVVRAAKRLDYDFQPLHMYEFTITATDNGTIPKSGSTTVRVWMHNVNDEAPVFEPQQQMTRIKEFSKKSLLVHVIQAYDPDGDNITYKFTNGNATNQGSFELNQNTGFIRLAKNLGRTVPNRNLSVTAMDDGRTHETIGYIDIRIIGVNHPPLFKECPPRVTPTVKENEPMNTSVFELIGIDDDSGSNGEVVFEVVTFNKAARPIHFLVEQSGKNATLMTLYKFDREAPLKGALKEGNQVKYMVTVQMRDKGFPKNLATNCFFFVVIEDVNDETPTFDENDYKTTIQNDTPQNTRILRVFAIDDDEGKNAEVEYTIVKEDVACINCLAINKTTGWISVKADISSQEKLTLTVNATDKGPDPRSSQVQVVITITNKESALPPKWKRPLSNVDSIDDINDLDLPEDAVNENIAFPLSFRATYSDTSSQLVYSLVPGRTSQENTDRNFLSSTIDGNMTITTLKLNYEIVSKFILKLRVSVLGKGDAFPYTDARLRVNVKDNNTEVPQFVGLDSKGKYPAAVSDTTKKGDYVLTVVAVDEDGTSPNNKVTYKWQDNCADCGAFSLSSETGNITANTRYTRSKKKEYQLRVIAEDGDVSYVKRNKVEIIVYVTVTGNSMNPPYFKHQEYGLSVNEGSPYDYTIGYVNATNPDTDNSITQYSFIEGNEDHTFGLNHTSGRIFVMRELRHSKKSSYTLKYRVFDGSAQYNTTIVVISVRPVKLYPPVFDPFIYTNTSVVEEDTTIRLLSTVTAFDPDKLNNATASLKYTIAGFHTQQHKDTFIIEKNGKVYLRRGLDRDYPNGHAIWQINIVATDTSSSTRKSGYAVLNLKLIDKNDNKPVFDTCCIDGAVAEHSPAGTSVLKVTAKDVDEGANAQVYYKMVDSPKSASNSDLFKIGNTDGLLETNVDRTVLDREVRDKYKVKILAYDRGMPRQEVNQTLSITITDINDNSPVFVEKSYTVEIPEEMLVGMPVTVVTAEDADIDKNAELTYSIMPGDGHNFYMDSIFVTGTGVVRIKKPIDFDGSTTHSYRFRVKVQDPDPNHTDIATVTVNVYDINDNAPAFTRVMQTISMREDRPVDDTVIANFTATDKDEGMNAQFEYSIDYRNTDPDKKFKIDKSTGEVKLRNQLDREMVAQHKVHVLAIDKGVPPQTGTATLIVTVTDVNDNAPELIKPYNFVVRQTTTSGFLVGHFKVQDKDTPQNGPPFTIKLNCNKPECKDFILSTGRDEDERSIRAARTGYKRATLGRDRYLLPIVMSDNPTSGQSAMTATGTLTITIESSNDNQNAPGEKVVTVYNYKRSFDDLQLGKVFDEDVDDMKNPGKKYEFFGEHDNRFTLDGDTGVLTMKEGMSKGEHEFKVKVTDPVWNEVISSVTVNVIYLEKEQVRSSGSLRLTGITAEEFIRKPKNSDGSYEKSKYDKMRTQLASLLSTDEDNVLIFTVKDVMDAEMKVKTLDIMYAAHGSPWYRPARLNGLMWSNKNKVESAVGVNIVSSPINECLNKQCWDSGCTNELQIQDTPLVVNTGKMTLIGVKASYVAFCRCGGTTFRDMLSSCGANTCLNGDNCTDTRTGHNCTYLEGFTGPRCQQLKVSFTGAGWAWFEPLSQCEDGKTSFEFLTTKSNTLLLYNGPMNNNDPRDFISVELVGGHPKLRVDLGEGEIVLEVTTGQKLDNGKWHTLEIFKNNRKLRLVVDHCMESVIDENIANSTEDRSMCEAKGEVGGEHFLLNVNTPLQLGGRANPSVNYPSGLGGSYTGCIKNLRHNGLLYDLHVGKVGESKNTQDGCPNEENSCSHCPINSTCVGSMGTEHTCVCNPGLRGDNCDEDMMVKDFYQKDDSFIEWELKPTFNTSKSSRHFEIQIMFRTRQSDGTVFSAASFSTLERLQLRVVSTHLQFICDLGSGDEVIHLDHVNVSDGQWHIVRVSQYGNQLILRLDGGEGKYYTESPPHEEHRLISLSGQRLFGAADVTYKKYVKDPTRRSVLVNSCMKDVRYNFEWFPMDGAENSASDVAQVVKLVKARSGCGSAACDRAFCHAPQFCFDMWRNHECRCPLGQRVVPLPDYCVDIVDCSIDRCDHGDCVCIDGHWHCNCDEGWKGPSCTTKDEGQVEDEPNAALSLGMILIVVFSIIILLIIILALVIITRRRKPDLLLGVDPDDDIRENVGYYDEEGAGEEDMHAYDLSRLQKPVDGDTDSMIKPPLDNPAFQPEIPLTGPEPMTSHPPFLPGDNPNIGNFIDDRMKDADDDPNAPPYDSLHEYDYEGNNSEAGSLSSLQSSSSGDQDFDYLNDFGPRFQKLADLYGGGDSDDEDEENASSV